MPKFFILFLALYIFQFSATHAADLSGLISDEGDPITMADIILANMETNIVSGAQLSDEQGKFKFSVLPGTYNLMISKRDYAKFILREIIVQSENITKNIELTPIEFASDGLPTSSDDCD